MAEYFTIKENKNKTELAKFIESYIGVVQDDVS